MTTKNRCNSILHSTFAALALAGLTMLTNGCDMIEYHPYDLNIKGDTDINRKNIQTIYNPQIQISAESETKRSIFREKDKTKRSKKESAQHSKSRNKSFVMTSVSAL